MCARPSINATRADDLFGINVSSCLENASISDLYGSMRRANVVEPWMISVSARD